MAKSGNSPCTVGLHLNSKTRPHIVSAFIRVIRGKNRRPPVVVVVAVIIFSEFGASHLGWGAMAFRVALAAVIFVPAFYFAKESGGHRRTANRLRRIELELTALEPFLRDLPVDQRNEILKKKSDEYFGRDTEAGSETDGPLTRYLMLGRFAKLLGQIIKVADVIRGNK